MVEVVKEVELVEDEEDRAAGLSEREVLVRDLLDLRHDDVCLLYLPRDVRSFSLERLERLDNPGSDRQCKFVSNGMGDSLVVVEDVALRLVERRQKALLEGVELGSELALETKEVGSLAVGVGSLDSKDLVERLSLQTRTSDLDTCVSVWSIERGRGDSRRS